MRFPNICDSCSRLVNNTTSLEEDPPGTCAAFPDGIPKEIWVGGFDHRKPLGNESILWELDAEMGEFARNSLDRYIRIKPLFDS